MKKPILSELSESLKVGKDYSPFPIILNRSICPYFFKRLDCWDFCTDFKRCQKEMLEECCL